MYFKESNYSNFNKYAYTKIYDYFITFNFFKYCQFCHFQALNYLLVKEVSIFKTKIIYFYMLFCV